MSADKRYLLDFEVGETFTGFFVIRQKELRTRRDGAPYLMLEFGDRSGRLRGNIWNEAQSIYDQLNPDDIVKLCGIIETYQGSKQVGVKQIRRVDKDDQFDYDDFLPVSKIDPQKALDRIKRYAAQFSNPFLKQLLNLVFDDEDMVAELLRAPGGKLWHHNRIGGLIEHTCGVVRICAIIGRMYPQLDRDLLIAGAFLHDIGKIREYKYQTSIDYTDQGRLIGHIVIGAEWVMENVKRIDGFPDDLRDKLVHLVLSHQDEFGSPVLPSTREAFVLHYADQIDSKMDALQRISDKMPVDQKWTFVRLLERHLLLDKDNPDEDFKFE